VQGNNGSLSKDPAEGRELTSTPALIALQQISFDAPLALEFISCFCCRPSLLGIGRPGVIHFGQESSVTYLGKSQRD
jgi:hypothetical protein